MSLEGRIAVVTGGANGIGAAIVRQYRRDGATVAILDVQEPDLDALIAIDGPGDLAFFPCDVTDGAAVESASQAVIDRFGAPTILVNNAGGSGKTPARTPEENTDEIWHYVMDLNITSIIRFCRAFVPGMRKAGFGRIINMSSGARHSMAQPFVTMKSHLAYVTAKGAMVGLSKQLGRDLGPAGITCNAIAPGMILPDEDARITKIIRSQPQAMQDAIIASIAARRFGDGEDVAAVASFLASDGAGYVNGQTIDVAGG